MIEKSEGCFRARRQTWKNRTSARLRFLKLQRKIAQFELTENIKRNRGR
jgi:hypothetical protein